MVTMLGATNFDEIIVTKTAGLGNKTPLDDTPSDSGYSLCRNLSPVAYDADDGSTNIEGSRGGIKLAEGSGDHTNNSEVHEAPSTDFVTHHVRANGTVTATFLFTFYNMAGLTSAFTGNAGVDGLVRIAYNPQTATTYRADLQTKSAGAWSNLDTTGASLTEGTQYMIALQTDLTGGSEQARVLVDGASYGAGWKSTSAIPGAGTTGTPGMGGTQLGAGTGGIYIDLSEVISTEDSSAGIDLGADSGVVKYRVSALYPTANGTNGVGNWVVDTGGGSDASCDEDEWRLIDDPEDEADDGATDDWMATPSATQTDCYFKHEDIDSGATLLGVAILNVNGGTLGGSAHCKDNGNTVRQAFNSGGATDQLDYKTLTTAPDGGAWTIADVNNSEFGMRGAASGIKSYALTLIVVGKDMFGTESSPGDQVRMTKNTDCPAASTFTPRVMIY